MRHAFFLERVEERRRVRWSRRDDARAFRRPFLGARRGTRVRLGTRAHPPRYPNPYEALKQLTRTGKPITEADIRAFVEGLDVAEAVKAELRAITPHTYVGVFDASEFAPTA